MKDVTDFPVFNPGMQPTKNEGKVMPPISLITSAFVPARILYNVDSFVIAEGTDKYGNYCMACRWHPPTGLGYPNGFGKPQWFILPTTRDDFLETHNDAGEAMLSLNFMKPSKMVYPGHMVRIHDTWYYVMSVVAGTAVAMIMSDLGETPHPVSMSDVDEISRYPVESRLMKWHYNRVCLWLDQEGCLAMTYPPEPSESDPFIYYEHIMPLYLVSEKERRWQYKQAAERLAFTKQLDGWILIQEWPLHEMHDAGCLVEWDGFNEFMNLNHEHLHTLLDGGNWPEMNLVSFKEDVDKRRAEGMVLDHDDPRDGTQTRHAYNDLASAGYLRVVASKQQVH